MTLMKKWIVIVSALSLLSGCAYPDYFERTPKVEYPPTYPIDNVPPKKRDGTIYQSGYEISLYQDRVAYHVGDILMIKLEEQTQGEKKAKTNTDKKADNVFTAGQFFGANVQNGLALDTSTNIKFDGTGESNQQNKLNGTISVTVVRVLANGNLMVQGESWITINFGREYIQLTGIVRTEDINPDNTISSQRVANARITYSGNGQVADSTRGGIITQFLNKYWPY